MNIVGKLKCAFTQKQSVIEYYQKLSVEQLELRKKNLGTVYLITSLGWTLALVLTLVAGTMSTPVAILYAGVVLALFITTLSDYRKRSSLIDDIIKKKTNS